MEKKNAKLVICLEKQNFDGEICGVQKEIPKNN